jgi:hypothetical protein
MTLAIAEAILNAEKEHGKLSLLAIIADLINKNSDKIPAIY